MKRFFIFCCGWVLLLSAAQTQAQTTPSPTPAREATSEEIANSDLVILANVTAQELKFEVVPNPTVEFSGTPERKTVWEADRQNLPRPVEPGVTYRNIGIQLRITSRFADIDRIVAEALGEIPITDDSTTDNSTTDNPPSRNRRNNRRAERISNENSNHSRTAFRGRHLRRAHARANTRKK